MNVTFWLCVCLISATIGLGHLGYVHYFAGEPAGDAVLFDKGEPQTHQIDIAETDFPIRLNLEMWGNRKQTGPVFLSLVTLETAGAAGCEPIEFQAVISKDDDIVNVTAGSGNATLQVGSIRSKIRGSEILNCSSSGNLTLSANVTEERDFEMDRIEVAIRFNSRGINWILAGPSLGVLLLSFIMLVVALRKKYPHLAS